MVKLKKVMLVFGTRPEAIKMAPLLLADLRVQAIKISPIPGVVKLPAFFAHVATASSNDDPGESLFAMCARIGANETLGKVTKLCHMCQLVSDELGHWSFEEIGRLERPNYNTLTSVAYVYVLRN